ncbi:MAG: hypothetical protein PHW11_06960 [Anaerolineaceae bacterium]|mgnify:CR=1 FL=1|jgi:tRNA nucleotidyltransferase/poly(A) polymerase|nr:hypothetical protein [Anaerolineaceae bacterium]MDD4043333.1 hypothetical protein [Anaerolineaceae bacterium]MDD4578175.1 hypothetical protein [Anaerolineaceae bacterium]
MNLHKDEQLAAFLREVRSLSPDQKVYLVGGAVRDLVLGRNVKDLDFVTADGSVELAKAVRRRFDGVWYTLDDQHQTARVILKQGQPGELILDFTAFVGGSLEEDLSQRDFTINAMAIDLDNLEEVIDLLGGQADLRDRDLRLSNPQSLMTDPLRVLRAVRMVRTFELVVNPETIEKLRIATISLNRISGERIRDELLKCLAIPGLSATYHLLGEYGILFQLLYRVFKLGASEKVLARAIREHFPSMPDFIDDVPLPEWSLAQEEAGKTGNPLDALENLIEAIDQKNQEALFFTECPSRISSPGILEGLTRISDERLQGGRTRKQLLILFALFFWHHLEINPVSCKTGVASCLIFGQKLTNAFMLGQKEQKFFEQVCKGFHKTFSLSQQAEVGPLELYRYFTEMGSFGLEAALLHITNQCVATTANERLKLLAETIILSWFNDYETIVDPPQLIDGDDLQETLQLKPGPEFGLYLESIREAQVMGEIKNRDAALAHVSKLLNERKEHEN